MADFDELCDWLTSGGVRDAWNGINNMAVKVGPINRPKSPNTECCRALQPRYKG